jgi:hypothetical protein
VKQTNKPDFAFTAWLGFAQINLLTKRARQVAQTLELPNGVVRTYNKIIYPIMVGTDENCQIAWESFQKTTQTFLKEKLTIA